MSHDNFSSRRLLAALLISFPLVAGATGGAKDRQMAERGRYLILVAGCNDCHTAGYAPSDGKVPEKDWLMGDRLGYRGAWGTTYPPNLRRYFNQVSEADWLKTARNARYRPPMPSPALRAMSDQDLRALYRYVRSLGPAEAMVPAYLPPPQQPAGPVVQFPLPPG